MKLKTTLLASAIGSLMAMAAQANVVTYTGDTSTTGTTYDRVNVDSSGKPTAGSSTGAGVNYNAYSFTVSASGNYSVTTAGAYDTFGTLYANGFNPSASLTNAVAANDDLAGIGTSGLSYNLTAGTVYTYVNSAFTKGTPSNPESGFFSTSINGLGTIVPITVPAAATPSSRVLTYGGTTVGGPTYDRADIDNNGSYLVSGSSTSVAYKTFSFTVGAVGTYSFITNGDYDTFLSLYAGAFDPSNAVSHLIGLNDDAYNQAYYLQAGLDTDYLSHVSAFATDLTIGTTYTLVTSGFGNTDFGSFSNAITGPGAVRGANAVTAVPEPDVLALMLSGFGLMGITARRRKSNQA